LKDIFTSENKWKYYLFLKIRVFNNRVSKVSEWEWVNEWISGVSEWVSELLSEWVSECE
jgi:hypothetical protein